MGTECSSNLDPKKTSKGVRKRSGRLNTNRQGFPGDSRSERGLRKFSIRQEYRKPKYKNLKLTSVISKMASNLQ